MNPNPIRFWRICLAVFLLVSLRSPAVHPAVAKPALAFAPTAIDPVATDPLNDINEPNLDLHRLWVWDDATNYYISFDAYAAAYGMTYGVYIDTDQVAGSGAASDPWGRNVAAVSAHLPEYALYAWLDGETDALGDAQLNHWTGSEWTYPTLTSLGGSQTYNPTADTIDYVIPKAALGSPSRIAVEVFTTGSGGHAQDTVPSDLNVAFPEPDWNGSLTTTLSSFYLYPAPTVSLSISAPTEGQVTTTANLNVNGQVTPAAGSTVQITVNSGAPITPVLVGDGYFGHTVTLIRGENIIVVQAVNGTDTTTVTRHVYYGYNASHDNDIIWDGLRFDSRDPLYRSPVGAVTTGTPVRLRLRAASNDLTAARVRVWNDRLDQQTMLDMTLAVDDGTYAWWEATVPASNQPTVYWYRFIAIDGTDTNYYEDDAARDSGLGQVFNDSPDNGWQITVYDPAYKTPDWVKNAVIYQIFPDRFRDGDSTNNPAAGGFFYGENNTVVRSNGVNWNTPICDPRAAGTSCSGVYSNNFYGGDLQGILDKLDYLKSIGVTTIYLNPIFESPSNHKYDATDYGVIDDNFGTLALFESLATQAAAKDMSIILDGVFNHTSSDSIYFDRYGRYSTLGACESQESPYRTWYYFTDVTPGTGTCVSSTGVANGATYESWFGYDSLPKLNAKTQAVRDLIWDGSASPSPSTRIASYWLASTPDTKRASGWRLDVGGDVDPGVTNDVSNTYWEGFRQAVRATNTDAYIVGEEWGNASSWLLGSEWDASMNYQFGTAVMGFWRDEPFVDNDHNSGSSAGVINPLTPSQLDNKLRNLQERAAPESYYAMMNLLDSHDTNRALFLLDQNTDQNNASLYADPNYKWSDAIQRLKGTTILQMTLPGAPTIYYGDEVGLVGPPAYAGGKWEDDPYNRQPFPWLDAGGTPFYTHLQTAEGQQDLLDHYTRLTGLRNAHPALRTGSFTTLLVDDNHGIYAYGRKIANNADAAIVILNQGTDQQFVDVNLAGYLPITTKFDNALTTATESFALGVDGTLSVTVPARYGMVLVATSGLTTAPAAVTNLSKTEDNAKVILNWTPVADVETYQVYRSLLSGGGYQLIGTSATPTYTYTDSTVQNGRTYYYVIVSQDAETLLTSGYSNEVAAIPHAAISDAIVQYPETLTHTIGITPTDWIYGQVYAEGLTNAAGAAPGLIAQVGYSPIKTAVAAWNTWVDAEFNVQAGNNDEYMGHFIPEATGTFYYVYRFSTTGGRDWVYADTHGIFTTPDTSYPGVLTVNPSTDSTSPAAPAHLRITNWSPSMIQLAWDAVTGDDTLYAYEVYRAETTGGPYAKVDRVLAPATTYTDDTVTAGTTYYYIVRALDTSFNASLDSNEANAKAETRMVQVTFRVGVPAYTPGDVYLVGDLPALGSWNPGQLKMTKINDTTWETTLALPDGQAILYKYARGSWDKVEWWGSITSTANRSATIAYGETGLQLIDNTATDWGTGADNDKAVQTWRDPIVVQHSPASDATGVALSAPITVTWSTAMPDTTSFSVTGPGDTAVAGAFAYAAASKTVTFQPAQPFAPGKVYTVSVTGQKNTSENTQQVPVQWTFTTTYLYIYLPVIAR